MTIKLLLLKSGEDIITDVSEMVVGEEEERRVVGQFFDRPCVVKMRDPREDKPDRNTKKTGFAVTLFPWMPLSKEDRIPVAADWVITMVEPVTKLKEMYQKDVATYGKDDQDNSVSKSTDANK